MNKDDYLGRVIYSKAGRDAKRFFIIVNVIDDEYVQIADGDLRKVDNPKKKKIKHISILEEFSVDIMERLQNKEYVNNSMIRKFLENRDANKEV
ncbi:RNA-binding protein [Clostridium sediminicola]|uniref:RNA-binding protein n=1 Tax=Clostridium sediminicola TaxID=3114879 RepID=UPI0031F26C20